MITFEEALIVSSIFFLLAVPLLIKSIMRYFVEKMIRREVNWTEI